MATILVFSTLPLTSPMVTAPPDVTCNPARGLVVSSTSNVPIFTSPSPVVIERLSAVSLILPSVTEPSPVVLIKDAVPSPETCPVTVRSPALARVEAPPNATFWLISMVVPALTVEPPFTVSLSVSESASALSPMTIPSVAFRDDPPSSVAFVSTGAFTSFTVIELPLLMLVTSVSTLLAAVIFVPVPVISPVVMVPFPPIVSSASLPVIAPVSKSPSPVISNATALPVISPVRISPSPSTRRETLSPEISPVVILPPPVSILLLSPVIPSLITTLDAPVLITLSFPPNGILSTETETTFSDKTPGTVKSSFSPV